MNEPGLTDANEPELTREAKEAIRGYLLKMITLPGIFVTLLSFVIGYGIRDIAARGAELQASQQLSAAIANALAKSQAAEEKLKQAENVAARIQNLEELAKTFSSQEEFRNKVVEQLANDTDIVRYGDKVALRSGLEDEKPPRVLYSHSGQAPEWAGLSSVLRTKPHLLTRVASGQSPNGPRNRTVKRLTMRWS